MAVIDRIYEAVSDEEAFVRLPSILAPLVGARSCLISRRTLKLENSHLMTNYFSNAVIDYVMDPEISILDHWMQYGAQPHCLGTTIDADDIWDLNFHMNSGFYNEIIRKFGDDTTRCIGRTTNSLTEHISVAFHNGLGSPRFSAADASEITFHFPHIVRMLDLRDRLGAVRAHGDLLQRALDQIAGGVLAVDKTLRVRAANRRGVEMLAGDDGLRMAGGRITVSNASRQDRLAHAIRSAATWSGGRGDAILLPRAEGQPALRVLVSPMSGPHAVALVIIEDPEDQDPGMARTLRRLYGLTASEAELATLLAEGFSPEEAAEARDVRLSTVRTQIKRLLDKTEAARLLDLVRLLSRTPRGARSGGE